MALIGMLKARYSVITTGTDENGADTETYGAVKEFAKAITAATSINTSKVKLHADDSVAEMLNEFVSGQLTFTADEIAPEVEADVSGATIDQETGALVNKDTDDPRYVRFGFLIRRKKTGSEDQYQAVIFPKVMFDVPGGDYETKGESIVFKTTTVTAEILRNIRHEWRIRSKWMKTEEEAMAYLTANIAPAGV